MGTNKRIFAAKAKSWGLGEAGTGKEQVAVEFETLTEGADVKSITWFGYFTENTWERTIESLRYCGWKGEDLSDLSGLDANEVDLVIEDEEYQGNTYAKVQWVNRRGGLALKAPLTVERAKSFAASMKDKIKALEASKGQKKAPNGARAQAPSPEQASGGFDVPF